jgi:RHS repeat-associated protein
MSVTWSGGPSYGIKAFTGREWDPEIGLHYYRARYYDPKVGRFISEDPIGFRGGVDFYTYVLNRPTVLADPSGLVAGGIGLGGFGVIVEIIGAAGGGDMKIVVDHGGNFGFMVCLNGGLSVGSAGGAGGTVTYTLGSGSICDLTGLSVQAEGGGGKGVFAKGSVGGYIGSNSIGLVGSVGIGAGVGAYGSVQAVGCKLIWSNRPCNRPCKP